MRYFPGSGSVLSGKSVFSEFTFVYNISLTSVSGESLPTYFLSNSFFPGNGVPSLPTSRASLWRENLEFGRPELYLSLR